MRAIVTPQRINLSKDSYYWMRYYIIPTGLIAIGILFLIVGLIKGFSAKVTLIQPLLMVTGGSVLFYWLFKRLLYKTHVPKNKTTEEFRKELSFKLSKNGWHFYKNTKKYIIANKRSEILVVYYNKTNCKWCLTGDFIRFGPLFSIVPYYPKGKNILKELEVNV